MRYRQGFTLIEILVVLIIVGVITAFIVPNFFVPNEQAKAVNARNNILAIYSAERNYYNNHGSACINSGASPTCADNLTDINSSFSLNIQDDGSYTYLCQSDASGFACLATRNNPPSNNPVIKVTNAPIQLTGAVNPTCTGSNSSWCT